MLMSKKDIIETLKAMEVEFDGRNSRDELQRLLDESMGTASEPEPVAKEVIDEEKEYSVTSVNNRKVNFSDIIKYNLSQIKRVHTPVGNKRTKVGVKK